MHCHNGLPQLFGKRLDGVRNSLRYIHQPAVVHISGKKKEVNPDKKNCVSVRHGTDLLHFPILKEVGVQLDPLDFIRHTYPPL